MSEKKNSNQIKSCTLYVDGMHCASCEVLIEKKLLSQKGVKGVNASFGANKVELEYQADNKPGCSNLNKEFESLGYKFSYEKLQNTDIPFISFSSGSLRINSSKVKSFLGLVLVVLSLIVGFFILEKLQFGKYVGVDSNSALPAFFALGLVASISSCAALVGGLLLSMAKSWNELYIDQNSKAKKAKPHIMFHIGRIISFVFLGGLLGAIGETISLSNSLVFSVLTIVVSLVMVILALQMLGISWAKRFHFRAPKVMTRYVVDQSNFGGQYMPFIIGFSTFFLPCGFTLVAQTMALASGSFLQGALMMGLFALGTLPILLSISYSGILFNSSPLLTARFNFVAGLIVIFFALYNINGQLNVLSLPSLSDISFGREVEANDQFVEVNNEGEQVLKIVADGFEYKPIGPTTIKAGLPLVLEVDNKGIDGCGVFIASYGLIDGNVFLKPGKNEIDLGKPTEGTYKITCSMGMVPPVTIKVV